MSYRQNSEREIPSSVLSMRSIDSQRGEHNNELETCMRWTCFFYHFFRFLVVQKLFIYILHLCRAHHARGRASQVCSIRLIPQAEGIYFAVADFFSLFLLYLFVAQPFLFGVSVLHLLSSTTFIRRWLLSNRVSSIRFE